MLVLLVKKKPFFVLFFGLPFRGLIYYIMIVIIIFLSFLACVAIAEELNYSISQTDPKKMIHVGGFRLKPDGSLTDKKV